MPGPAGYGAVVTPFLLPALGFLEITEGSYCSVEFFAPIFLECCGFCMLFHFP
jgi:hypothetical protein